MPNSLTRAYKPFYSTVFEGSLTGSASSATSFTDPLVGDVSGPQSATIVDLVGGETAANVALAAGLLNGATSANTPLALVQRDASGGFAAGTITAALSGNADTSTTATSFTGNFSGEVTGPVGTTAVATLQGYSATDVANGAVTGNASTATNTAGAVVRRDASNQIAAGTVTASLSGNATTATTATNFTGSFSGDVTGTAAATVASFVGGQTGADVAAASTLADLAASTLTTNQLLQRDVSGNFSAGTVVASLSGNATTASSTTNLTGMLAGDVTGTQAASVVSTVGGQAAATVASSTVLLNAATSLNTASQIVRRDGSGNFAAGTITAALSGDATTATTATVTNGLKTATTTVSVSAATAPTAGQALVASSSTLATWKYPATYFYASVTGTISTTSAGTTLTSPTLTPGVAGTYFVVFSATTQNTSGSFSYTIRLITTSLPTIAGTTRTFATVSSTDVKPVVTRGVFAVSASDTISVAWGSSGGSTSVMTTRSMFALRVA